MMFASSRQRARSTRLWVAGVLAWLMLVAQAVPAAPIAYPAMAASVAHAAIAMHDDRAATCDEAPEAATPAAATDHDGCCGNATTAHCPCAAMCASALLPLPSWTVATTPAFSGIAEWVDRAAPRRPVLPPRRPPQA